MFFSELVQDVDDCIRVGLALFSCKNIKHIHICISWLHLGKIIFLCPSVLNCVGMESMESMEWFGVTDWASAPHLDSSRQRLWHNGRRKASLKSLCSRGATDTSSSISLCSQTNSWTAISPVGPLHQHFPCPLPNLSSPIGFQHQSSFIHVWQPKVCACGLSKIPYQSPPPFYAWVQCKPLPALAPSRFRTLLCDRS